jgi:hypothetical protein
MKESELQEVLQQYEDENSATQLMEFLKDELIEKLEDFPADSDRQKHNLNLVIREIEEELDWIENEKLTEFDPEQQ